MINKIGYLEHSNNLIFSSPFVKQLPKAQVPEELLNDYYNIIVLLSGDDCALSEQGLCNLKQLLQNENKDDTNSYKFLEKILSDFSKISSDGNVISSEDFIILFNGVSFKENNSVDKFSIAQDIVTLLSNTKNNLSIFLDFFEQFSEDTLEKIGTKQRFSEARGERKFEVMKEYQEASVSEQIRLRQPIDISI